MARGRQMGRLKLKRLSEETRNAYLYEWKAKDLVENPRDFPKLTSPAIFGNQAPLEVEIGPGTGEYLCDLAARHPETNFLGVEASRRALSHAVGRAGEAGLENIRFIHVNFKLLYPLMVPESWSKVYLHFPDPVHKRKDEKQRIFDAAFLDKMAQVLIPGGETSVVSDEHSFFMQMLERAEGDARFEKTHPERYLEGFEPPKKSRFQRSWERKGVVPLRFVLRKTV